MVVFFFTHVQSLPEIPVKVVNDDLGVDHENMVHAVEFAWWQTMSLEFGDSAVVL